MADGLCAYECWIDNTNAAYARLGRALVECRVKLIDSYRLGSRAGDTVMLMVRAEPARVAAFAEVSRVHDLKYRSPTVFDNGTLRAKFASAEDELAGRLTEAAKRVMAETGGET